MAVYEALIHKTRCTWQMPPIYVISPTGTTTINMTGGGVLLMGYVLKNFEEPTYTVLFSLTSLSLRILNLMDHSFKCHIILAVFL